MGAGIEPELGFTHDLPLAEQGGGIRVDASLRAAGRVWVAGDIASVDGIRIEHWRLAQQHGRVAALAMLGQEARYEGVPFFWTFHFGKRLGYLGHAQEWEQIITEGDVAKLEFMNLYVQDGLVKAALSCGRDHQMAQLAERMRGELTVQQARAALA
jgi:NADPH-dependent 2,4-dienoyl-CoA reductase/sulfur reductase-like enzyme